MPALSCARHWRRDPAGTAHVCEDLFTRASRPLRSYTVTLLCRRSHMADQANLLSAVICRTSATSDSCSRRCILLTKRLVVSGHLSTNSALLIDRSAEPARVAPREHARCEALVKILPPSMLVRTLASWILTIVVLCGHIRYTRNNNCRTLLSWMCLGCFLHLPRTNVLF